MTEFLLFATARGSSARVGQCTVAAERCSQLMEGSRSRTRSWHTLGARHRIFIRQNANWRRFWSQTTSDFAYFRWATRWRLRRSWSSNSGSRKMRTREKDVADSPGKETIPNDLGTFLSFLPPLQRWRPILRLGKARG